ncbi:DUF4240 domain-containing protein [Aquiflexum sp.]|uniref:DUF4240 domain-containing protein n=1 Tax=Aquiflexum sp. TaxID=1872584 RepID=UPI0035945DEC
MEKIFNFFGPQGTPAILGLLAALVVLLIRALISKKENKQSDQIFKGLFQKELKKAITTRESIKVNDFLMVEADFWKLIDKTRLKSKNNFKNHCGLLNDYFSEMESTELLAFNGRLFKLFYKLNTNKLQAAFSIINYSVPFENYQVFLEWVISKGEVLANNYSDNPELMVNADFSGIEQALGISQYLGELYYAKTSKLLPEIEDFDEGPVQNIEDLSPKMIPDYFPKLWEKFITDLQ